MEKPEPGTEAPEKAIFLMSGLFEPMGSALRGRRHATARYGFIRA
jgi:hypothetical protein